MAIYWFKIILPIVLAVMSFNLVKSQVCSENVDLTIIIDCTGDVTAANFILVQQFFHAFVDASNLEITFGTTRVNFIQYDSTFVSSGNYLTSNRRAQTTIDDMTYLGGTTRDTAGALSYYIDNPSSNDRPGNQNVVILLLVGPSADKTSAIQYAETIHNRGDDILVIGVTSDVDVDEIQQLTSSPRVEGQNYFLFNDYSDLDGKEATVATGLCNRDNPAPTTTTTPTTETPTTEMLTTEVTTPESTTAEITTPESVTTTTVFTSDAPTSTEDIIVHTTQSETSAASSTSETTIGSSSTESEQTTSSTSETTIPPSSTESDQTTSSTSETITLSSSTEAEQETSSTSATALEDTSASSAVSAWTSSSEAYDTTEGHSTTFIPGTTEDTTTDNKVLLIAILVPLLTVLLVITTTALLCCCCRQYVACCCRDNCTTEVESDCGPMHCTEPGAVCVTSCFSSCCHLKEKSQPALSFSNLQSVTSAGNEVYTSESDGITENP